MVNIERSKLNQAMYQKLKKFIMNKRKQELHEKKQDAYFKRLKKEKEERKRQAQLDSETLEQIKADIEESKKKVEELKTRKSELFQRFKHLANEESRLKDKHRSEQAAQMALHGTQFGAAQSAIGHLPLSAATAGHHPATPAHPHHSQLTYNNATAAALNILQQQSSVPAGVRPTAVQAGNSGGSAVHQQKMLIGLQQNTGAANALLPTTKRNQLSSGSPLQPVTQPLQVIAGSGAYAAGSVTTQVPGSAYSLGSKVNTVIAVQPNTNSTAAAQQAQNQTTVVGTPGAGQQGGYPNAVSTAGKLTAGYPPQLYVDRSQAGALQGEIDPANLALLKAYNLQQNQQGLQPNYSHLVQNFGRQQNYLESLKSVSGASASVPVVSVAAAGGAASQVAGGSPAANVAAVASSLSNYGKSHLPPAATSYRGSITTGQSAQQIQLQQQQQQQIQAMQQAVQAVAQQQQAQAQAAAAHQQLLQQQILASLTVQAHQQQQAQAQAIANAAAQQQAAAAAAAAAAAVASQHSPKTQGSQGPATPFNVLSVPHQLAASAGVQGYPVSTAAPGAYSVYQAGQNAVAYQAAHQPQNWAARFSHNR